MLKTLDLTIEVDLTLFDDGHVEWQIHESPFFSSGSFYPGAQGAMAQYILKLMAAKAAESAATDTAPDSEVSLWDSEK